MKYCFTRRGLFLLAHHNLSRTLSAALLALSLTSCTAPSMSQAESADDVQQLLDRAHSVTLEQRAPFLLEAGSIAIKHKQLPQAQQVLKEINELKLDPTHYAQARVLAARLALLQNKPAQAVSILQDRQLLESLAQLDAGQQIDVSLLRAEAHAANRNYYASAQERIFVEPLLQTAQVENNRREIREALMQLNAMELQQRFEASKDERMRGWLQTALAAKSQSTGSGNAQWTRQMPVPITSPHALAANARLEDLPAESISQIALLLPLSGKLANFGEAVRDGFLAARYDAQQRGEHVPGVRFYDTENTGVVALYQQAAADGAALVIGPLEKLQVAQFYGQQLSVPLLALNRADLQQTPPANLYQFSLAPEDETAQIADFAAHSNYRQALVIATEEDLRSREFQTLQQRWQSHGGTIVATATFHDQQSMSSSIRSALSIPRSEARAREMENLLNRKIESVPHRRRDVDVVFMLAKPAQARLIKPLLDFYYAGDLPVYSTSRIYGGYAAAATQRDDLDKVRFTEMPWVLQQSELKQRILTAQPASKNYLRLYAMGIDSFGLSSRLSQLKASTNPVQAQTGSLSVDAQNIVQRQSRLAEIRNGAAIAADETP